MKLAVLALASVALAACSAAAPSDESAASIDEAMAVVNPQPIVRVDPFAACSAVAADATLAFSSSYPSDVAGTSDATRACDYFVVDVTGGYGHSIAVSVLDADPSSPVFSTQVTDAASCAKSSASYESLGYTSERRKGATRIAGTWTKIESEVVMGSWVAAPGGGHRCAFDVLESDPTGWHDTHVLAFAGASPYSTIRVASAITLYTAAGVVRAPMWTSTWDPYAE